MLKQTAFTSPDASAASTMAAVSPLSTPSGFSHTTCLPAASEALAWAAWTSLGLATCTTSTVSSARTASRSS